jgi:hypothetical protein
MEVTDCQSGFRTFACVEDTLRTEKNIGHAISGDSLSREVRYRLARRQKFQTAGNGELHHFAETVS